MNSFRNPLARVPHLSTAVVLLATLGATCWLALPATAQEASIKIAVVDLEAVVALSPGGKALGKELEDFEAQVKAEVEQMRESARDIQTRMRDGANSLSEDKLAEMQKQLEDLNIAIRRLVDDKQREGQKKQQEGLREIEKQLEPVFNAIRDEEGYDLILNRVPGVVVMAGERVDITQKVIDRLEAESAG
ncbi:MAG: OmpH family outer membrane protein [Thermoanaerobaculia bacterium]|nr:OmpH family outer membrane protein [Thermoanaerobaculia bacterium]